MWKHLLFWGLSIGLVVLIFSNHESNNVSTQPDRLLKKYEPSDEFFLQRSYPDGKFSIPAFENALSEAKFQAAIRDLEPGFDQKWTTQGPGNIGARINTIALHPQNEDIIYIGFAGGGVFKTTDGGQNWVPIFDDQLFLSIGDIALDPSNPEIVYVGTGDPNISGYPHVGNGIFKSVDGGFSWEQLGLTEQRIISQIIVDPSNGDNLFVGTMGLPFEKNNDRGLYKSDDGGATWTQSLFLSDSTGVCDVVMDPFDPQVLYAAGWDRIRNNSLSIASGLGAKVYKTIDGGSNWTLLEGGLPNQTAHSRIGLALSAQTPGLVYVQYASASNYQLEGIYKSENAGMSWDPIPIDPEYNLISPNALGGFGWYFGKIRLNPFNDDDLYVLGVDLWRTQSDGLVWSEGTPPWFEYSVHADKHDLVFTPSGKILLATDGGLYKADVSGDNWEDIENIPATQFYRVAYNPHIPEFYYGGAQDNGSTGGNTSIIDDWPRIYGGDGFQMAFDPLNDNRVFAETQRGNIVVSLDGAQGWESGDEGIDGADRRNWDMPYFISPHDPEVLYAGTYRVYKGEGEVPFWDPISEDLTDGTEEQHRYHNITALHESPILEGLLYAGTGDGRVWKSPNGGLVWEDISEGLPDQYITDVEASPDMVSHVYASISGYRDNDNLPRLHRSSDQGGSWEDISGDLPDLAINDIEVLEGYQDSIIFVATDGGVYGTQDAGVSWHRLGTNMPIILVFDLVHNPFNNELVAGTFARGIQSYPLDSLTEGNTTGPTSTNEIASAGARRLNTYPSPATERITFSWENVEEQRSSELVVLDSQGNLVHRRTFSGKKQNIELDISQWPAGTYHAKVKIRHDVISSSFLKL
ncbi:MAG: hypothetical protein HKN16_03570 [Saprospiraceae bacterium]|nr:hypothetical protein [Saprospiraceae bacterium]